MPADAISADAITAHAGRIIYPLEKKRGDAADYWHVQDVELRGEYWTIDVLTELLDKGEVRSISGWSAYSLEAMRRNGFRPASVEVVAAVNLKLQEYSGYPDRVLRTDAAEAKERIGTIMNTTQNIALTLAAYQGQDAPIITHNPGFPEPHIIDVNDAATPEDKRVHDLFMDALLGAPANPRRRAMRYLVDREFRIEMPKEKNGNRIVPSVFEVKHTSLYLNIADATEETRLPALGYRLVSHRKAPRFPKPQPAASARQDRSWSEYDLSRFIEKEMMYCRTGCSLGDF